jgi:predicted nucleic acid-binding protein
MIRVLFDTNIILDIALKRTPFFEDALRLFHLIDKNVIVGNVTASTITDIYYLAKKEKGHAESLKFIKGLTEVVGIIGVDRGVIIQALNSDMKDFEDAVQASASEANEIEIILTRNKDDFKHASLRIITPKEFLASLKSN